MFSEPLIRIIAINNFIGGSRKSLQVANRVGILKIIKTGIQLHYSASN